MNTVHFVGAGPGAVDLLTLRAKSLLENADVVIYAGSLVNPELLTYTKQGCALYNSAKMTLDEVIHRIEADVGMGKSVVRLHTGDPSLYGAIREQMDKLTALH
ncbi:MAG: SAM-dependent methyltransferase, partial [Clostridiales bacterium]|nr:SAM-dependent methyltransferase [Clostridiales bacterium]